MPPKKHVAPVKGAPRIPVPGFQDVVNPKRSKKTASLIWTEGWARKERVKVQEEGKTKIVVEHACLCDNEDGSPCTERFREAADCSTSQITSHAKTHGFVPKKDRLNEQGAAAAPEAKGASSGSRSGSRLSGPIVDLAVKSRFFQATLALVLWIAHSVRPLSIINDYFFRVFVSFLNSDYILPSRSTIRRILLNLVPKLKEKVGERRQMCQVAVAGEHSSFPPAL